MPVDLPSPALRNLAEMVADDLRQAILAGTLHPGQRISDAEVAAQRGISRSPVRDALRQLEKDGLVVSAPNRGAAVREFSEADIRQLNTIRGMLEGLAASWACDHITDTDIAVLEGLCREMERALPVRTGEDRIRLQQPIEEFHRRVVAAAHAPLLEEILSSIWMQIRMAMATANRSPRVSELLHEHEVLIDALRRRDAAAAELAAREITAKSAARALPMLHENGLNGDPKSSKPGR